MTRAGSSTSKWCFECKHFEYLMFRTVGICNYYASSHFRHLIHDMHPGCPKFRKKE